MNFPSPIAFYIFSYPVRWYGIAYAIGSLLAWRWGIFLIKRRVFSLCPEILSDFLMIIMPSIIIGGRLGYVLLYSPSYFFTHPLEIFSVWKGGMAFHGAALACAFSSWWFCKRQKISWLSLTDCFLCGAPLGIFLGRIANFLNQELYGIPWKHGIVFPNVDSIARHPSQLYEAFFEGVFLFIVLNGLALKTRISRHSGMLSGCFLIGYFASRWICEYVREPDSKCFEFLGSIRISPGQFYSLPMLIFGIYLLVSKKNLKKF
ncbi:prolipoprotein diacylglyceryl transferase [Holospora undulata]|uniref:Phosphatidylglycerol--prolipoprotein diacylglyceryl transferase n=1 Tax=Holospora undulata HU1 TaxID=1321371 RepID=A0A061JGR3_9PROT|nr:prolipoprotein diacylglyceryl transferase [Holospora undulata]ETZ05326.1 prolipoprotein diacylglyceryl transferase [Holospora undulata HU1]